jgi:hypothetical protein
LIKKAPLIVLTSVQSRSPRVSWVTARPVSRVMLFFQAICLVAGTDIQREAWFASVVTHGPPHITNVFEGCGSDEYRDRRKISEARNTDHILYIDLSLVPLEMTEHYIAIIQKVEVIRIPQFRWTTKIKQDQIRTLLSHANPTLISFGNIVDINEIDFSQINAEYTKLKKIYVGSTFGTFDGHDMNSLLRKATKSSIEIHFDSLSKTEYLSLRRATFAVYEWDVAYQRTEKTWPETQEIGFNLTRK